MRAIGGVLAGFALGWLFCAGLTGWQVTAARRERDAAEARLEAVRAVATSGNRIGLAPAASCGVPR